MRSYVYYLLGPSVISIDKPIDIVPAINALGRLIVLVFLVILIFKKVPMPSSILYLMIVYFFVTFLWSIGTTNFGQAFRHNSLTDWILALVFIIGVQASLRTRNQPTTQT